MRYFKQIIRRFPRFFGEKPKKQSTAPPVSVKVDGDKIRRLREAKQMTRDAVIESKPGFALSTLERAEKSERIRTEMAEAIARFLEIERHEIIYPSWSRQIRSLAKSVSDIVKSAVSSAASIRLFSGQLLTGVRERFSRFGIVVADAARRCLAGFLEFAFFATGMGILVLGLFGSLALLSIPFGETLEFPGGVARIFLGSTLSDENDFRDCDVCPTMAYVPRTPVKRTFANSPDTEYRVSHSHMGGFYISRTEVTVGNWLACMKEGYCPDILRDRTNFVRAHPVTNVTYYEALTYVDWLNSKMIGAPYVIPAEYVWEHAARIGENGKYYWGDSWEPSFANGGGKVDGLEPVARHSANQIGLHDMIGNAAEWTSSCWLDDKLVEKFQEPKDRDCSSSPIRGGGYGSEIAGLELTSRKKMRRSDRAPDVGFRVFRSY